MSTTIMFLRNRWPRRAPGFTLIEQLVAMGIVALLTALILPAVQACRESAWRGQCQNNLRQIGQALLLHHTNYGRFPPGRDGFRERDHSWATAVLPYLEHAELRRKYDYNQPWHAGLARRPQNPFPDIASTVVPGTNAAVAAASLAVFQCPSGLNWPGSTVCASRRQFLGRLGRGARAVVAAAVAASVTCVRADEQDTKAEVQAIYDHIKKAIERKDLDGVTRFSLPDATVKYADGAELTLTEWKERARKGWKNIKAIKSRFVVEEIEPNGEAAEATYSETHSMVVSDLDSGKEHKIDYEGRWRVRLKKTTGGWRLSRSVELERKVTRDGEVIEKLPKEKPKP
jgi:prepilin-type N-terminal cleavage/methylation domain-containing protein